jgi:hypothetical protein
VSLRRESFRAAQAAIDCRHDALPSAATAEHYEPLASSPVLELWKRSDAGPPEFVDEQHCHRSLLLVVPCRSGPGIG